MKLTVNRHNLQNLVSVVGVVVPTRTTLPALNGVLLRCKDGTLMAGASDIATHAIANCKAEGDDMAFGVNAALLSHFLSSCQGEDVVIELDQRATFTCGQKRATLTVIPEDQYGEPPAIEGGQLLYIKAQALHSALSRVLHAVAEDSAGLDRPVMASVLFDFTKGGLTLFGTDGKQIALVKLAPTGEGRFPVPKRLVGHILKLLDGADETVDVAVTITDKVISIESDFWTLSGSLLEGDFPDWPTVIPKVTEKVVVNRSDLSNALKSCMPFGEAGFTRVVIEGGNDTLRFSSGAGNECQDEIEAKCAPFNLAIEAKRLLNLVNALSGDHVTIEINADPGTPPRIMICEENFTGVLMPLRS